MSCKKRLVSNQIGRAALILALAITAFSSQAGTDPHDNETPLAFSFDILVAQAKMGKAAYQHALGHCFVEGDGG